MTKIAHLGKAAGPAGLGLALLLAACGGSDDGAGSGGGATAQPRMRLAITARADMPGSFGAVGTYEQLTGTLSGEVDPRDRHNAIIQDLALAPVNARGMVEYTADFVMLKPKDMGKAGGILRYDAPNRGNILTMPNLTTAPSDAVYFEQGYVWLFSAWQGDVPKSTPQRLTLDVPVARNADGSSITGPYVAELIAAAASPSLVLPGGTFNGSMVPYAPASLDNTGAGYRLTSRVNETDPRVTVPVADWKFAACDATNAFPGTPSGTSVCLRGGFQPTACTRSATSPRIRR